MGSARVLPVKLNCTHGVSVAGYVRLNSVARCAVLGFEDCSAKTETVSSSELSLTHPWSKQHEQLAPKAWSFYSFDVMPEDYQVVVNVAAELDSSCELTCQ